MSLITIDNKKVIVNAKNILDVTGGKLETGKSVIVEQGYIKSVVKSTDIQKENDGTRIIDLPGMTLLPGFVESHVHFALNGISFKDSIKYWQDPVLIEEKTREKLKDYLEYGIVAVRDGGDKAGIGLKAQEISKRDNFLAPIVHIPGHVIRKKGLYGSFLGKGITDSGNIKNIIEGLARTGVNHIKVLVSGIVSFNHYGKVGSLQFDVSEMKRIAEESHKFDLKIMAHASSNDAIKIAVQAGVDSIEHGYFITDYTLNLMKNRKTFWIPTVVPVYNQTVLPWRENINNKQLSIIEKTYDYHLKKIKKAGDMGVNIAVGTDAGAVATPHAKAFHEELQLYKRAGLSNLQILQAATINGARVMGLDDKIGSIEKGKLPCFIAIRGNPLENLDILRKPEIVIIPENLN